MCGRFSQAKDLEEHKELLVPYDSTKMEMYQVSDIVKSWNNDIPECLEEIKCLKK